MAGRAPGGPRRAAAFTKDINGLFAFEKLRPMADADMAAEQAQADFAETLPTSILPELIRLAKSRGVRLAFVRVQRRPRPDGPPLQSKALQRYIADLRGHLESEGAMLIDDTGNPAFTLDWYKDGDHLLGSKRRAYSDAFARTAAPLFEKFSTRWTSSPSSCSPSRCTGGSRTAGRTTCCWSPATSSTAGSRRGTCCCS